MEIRVHPNYGTSMVLVDDQPYHWDGDLCCYRDGYGPYSTMSKIGDWRRATSKEWLEVRTALEVDDGAIWEEE